MNVAAWIDRLENFGTGLSAGTLRAATVIFGGALLVAGMVLFLNKNERRSNLGAAMLSGAIITVGIFALQLVNEEVAQDELFEFTIATSGDLSGFDPKGESLRGLHLGGKTLNGAKFEGVDLRGTVLRDASLIGADLREARLQGADLVGVDFYRAEIPDAKLRNADLRAAKFEDAYIWSTRFRGALVNEETCWPRTFFKARLDDVGLDPESKSLGHVCKRGEHNDRTIVPQS